MAFAPFGMCSIISRAHTGEKVELIRIKWAAVRSVNEWALNKPTLAHTHTHARPIARSDIHAELNGPALRTRYVNGIFKIRIGGGRQQVVNWNAKSKNKTENIHRSNSSQTIELKIKRKTNTTKKNCIRNTKLNTYSYHILSHAIHTAAASAAIHPMDVQRDSGSPRLVHTVQRQNKQSNQNKNNKSNKWLNGCK